MRERRFSLGGVVAKRFTDTSKWDKSWFRKLTPELKCAWFFLCDKCDHAGIWDIDEDAFGYFVGVDMTIEYLIESMGGRIKKHGNDKLIIKSFIDFQYGTLNPKNRVHLSVINKLEKEGAYKPLNDLSEGAKDTYKDKYKEKEKEKESPLIIDTSDCNHDAEIPSAMQYLNNKTGVMWPAGLIKSLIDVLVTRGFKFEDFKRVIDYADQNFNGKKRNLFSPKFIFNPNEFEMLLAQSKSIERRSDPLLELLKATDDQPADESVAVFFESMVES